MAHDHPSEQRKASDRYMSRCTLCPRACGVNRLAGETGACGVPADVYVARAALHFWEEPCISGTQGSGAVFFTGCGLKCVYCQNAPISGSLNGRNAGSGFPEESVSGASRAAASSGGAEALRWGAEESTFGPVGAAVGPQRRTSGAADEKRPEPAARRRIPGKKVSVRHLADIFLRLQNQQHANNINLVTAAQYIPQAAEALRDARARGLTIPVVYNSSGYERVSSLRLLEGLVDIWLPDFKYMDPELARVYAHAPDYPDIAKAAVDEMVRQAGEPEFCEQNGQTLMKRGVIVRHLLLPGHVRNARQVVSWLHETYGNAIYISMMNQYTPVGRAVETAGEQRTAGHGTAGIGASGAAGLTEREELALLHRKVTKREYERLVDYAVGIGIENGFIQEGGTAKESFIPSWNGEGV